MGETISSKFRQFQKEYRSPILVHPYALTLLGQILNIMGGDSWGAWGIFTTQDLPCFFAMGFRPTPRIIHYFIATVCYLDL